MDFYEEFSFEVCKDILGLWSCKYEIILKVSDFDYLLILRINSIKNKLNELQVN